MARLSEGRHAATKKRCRPSAHPAHAASMRYALQQTLNSNLGPNTGAIFIALLSSTGNTVISRLITTCPALLAAAQACCARAGLPPARPARLLGAPPRLRPQSSTSGGSPAHTQRLHAQQAERALRAQEELVRARQPAAPNASRATHCHALQACCASMQQDQAAGCARSLARGRTQAADGNPRGWDATHQPGSAVSQVRRAWIRL